MSASTAASASPRVLIAYVTAGAGHRRAAEALADAVRLQYPNADVHCHDVLRDSPRWFHSGYAATYLFLVRHAPWIWKYSYAFLDHEGFYRCIQPFRRTWNCFIVRRWIKRLKSHPPDVVVVTHFLPADVCSAGKQAGWLKSRLVVVVTDYHPHWFWISKEPDAVIASIPESVEELRKRGVEASRIRVIGIPVAAQFSQSVDREKLRHQYPVAHGRQVVLVTSGGTTVGQFERVVEAIYNLENRLPGKLQLVVVCGEDQHTRTRLEQKRAAIKMPMQVFGFVSYMADLMALSDLIVSKAGGLTVSESLARGVPMVLYHVIPGQEQMNAEYIARSNAAVIARRPGEVGQAVLRYFSEPEFAQAMRQAVMRVRHPDSAARIVQEVIAPLLSSIKGPT